MSTWCIFTTNTNTPDEVVAGALHFAKQVDSMRALANRENEIKATILGEYNDALVTVIILKHIKHVYIDYKAEPQQISRVVHIVTYPTGVRLYPPSFVSGVVKNHAFTKKTPVKIKTTTMFFKQLLAYSYPHLIDLDVIIELQNYIARNQELPEEIELQLYSYRRVDLCTKSAIALARSGLHDCRNIKLYTPIHPLLAFMLPPIYRNREVIPQHVIQPALYSGLMMYAVQLVYGLGNNLYEYDYINSYAKLLRLKAYASSVDGKFKLAGSSVRVSVPSSLSYMQCGYSYHYYKTNGIILGERRALDYVPNVLFAFLAVDKYRTHEPFLVDISSSGLYVMPLPRLIETFIEKVRKIYIDMYPEIEQYLIADKATIFELFGGLPSGEMFPVGENLQKAIKAGIVVKADIDMQEFYNDIVLLSPDIGWSFAETEPCATNVRIFYKNGVPYSECWHLRIEVQQRSNITFCKYGAAIVNALKLTNQFDIMKAYLLDDSFAEGLLASPNKDVFDGYEVQPLWTVNVVKDIVADGYVIIDPITTHFKVPLRLFDTLLSVKLLPEKGADTSNIRIEGPIFSCFAGDELSMLCVYASSEPADIPSDFSLPDCIVNGKFEFDAVYNTNKLTAGFYNECYVFYKDYASTNFTRIEYEREYLGYQDVAYDCLADTWGFGVVIYTHRHLYARDRRKIISSGNTKTYRAAASCVLNCRNLYLMYEESTETTGSSMSVAAWNQYLGDTGYGGLYTIFNIHYHFLICNISNYEVYNAGKLYYGGTVYVISYTGQNWLFLRSGEVMQYYETYVWPVLRMPKVWYFHHLFSGNYVDVLGARSVLINEHIFKPYATLLEMGQGESCLAHYGPPENLVYGSSNYFTYDLYGTLGVYNKTISRFFPDISYQTSVQPKTKRNIRIAVCGVKYVHNRLAYNLIDTTTNESFDMWTMYLDGVRYTASWYVQVSFLGVPYISIDANFGGGNKVTLGTEDYISINPTPVDVLVGYIT